MKFYISYLQKYRADVAKRKLIIDATVKEKEKEEGDIKTFEISKKGSQQKEKRAAPPEFAITTRIPNFHTIFLHYADCDPDYIEMNDINLGHFSTVETNYYNIAYYVDDKDYYNDKLIECLKNKYVIIEVELHNDRWADCGWSVYARIFKNRNDTNHTRWINLTNYDYYQKRIS